MPQGVAEQLLPAVRIVNSQQCAAVAFADLAVAVFTNGLASGRVFPSLDESALLAEELGIAARDHIFESALAGARAV